MLVFVKGGKPENPDKNLGTGTRTNMCFRVWESNLGHSAGRQGLSPLRHPCTPNLLLKDFVLMKCEIVGTEADDKEMADGQGVLFYYFQSGTKRLLAND